MLVDNNNIVFTQDMPKIFFVQCLCKGYYCIEVMDAHSYGAYEGWAIFELTCSKLID